MSVSQTDLALFGGPQARPEPMPGRMAFGDEELALIHEVFETYREKGVDFGYQGVYEERYTEVFDNLLKSASSHTFGIKPSSALPKAKLTLVEIPVLGLDCKGCNA